MHWEYGFCLGFIAAFILHLYDDYTYKKILASKAKDGGSEKILGKWYRIIKE